MGVFKHKHMHYLDSLMHICHNRDVIGYFDLLKYLQKIMRNVDNQFFGLTRKKIAKLVHQVDLA